MGKKEYELWECKCGETLEISGHSDPEWFVCKKCGRRGCWQKEEQAEGV